MVKISSPKKFQWLGGCAGVGFLVALILLPLILIGAGGLLVIADPLEKADCVAILSGGGLPRMEEGARLYKEKYAKYVVITETGQSVSSSPEAYSTYLKLQLMDMGIDGGAIVTTEQHASSTREEAVALRKLLRQLNFKSCIVVTDSYHTFRTKQIFQKAFPNQDIKIIVRPVRGDWYNSLTWWLSPRGWQATLSEYAKLVALWMGVVVVD